MYEIKAKTTTIKAISRASVKLGEKYYTVEYGEERTLPDTNDVNLDIEREALWDDVNKECDGQIEEILKTFK